MICLNTFIYYECHIGDCDTVRIKKLGDSLILSLSKKMLKENKYRINSYVRVMVKDIRFISVIRNMNRYACYICIPRDIRKIYNLKEGDEIGDITISTEIYEVNKNDVEKRT